MIINFIPIKKIITNDYKVFHINKNELLLNLGLNTSSSDEKLLPVFESDEGRLYKIYLYNTHQTEEYADYDVYNATLHLKELLESNNIDCVVENTNIKNELNKRGYSYNYSYRITRELLNNKLKDKYDLYIDLHRDSSIKDVTTINIDGANYARVMFVLGKKHNTYSNNLKIVNSLNELLKGKNISLSRGVFTRENSSFNQDLASNVLLIELGGNNNTKEEVNNTLNILSNVISEYLNNNGRKEEE